MGTVHTCHQVNQLRPLHFVTPLLVLPRESESGTMLVSTAFNFLSERPCLLTATFMNVEGGMRACSATYWHLPRLAVCFLARKNACQVVSHTMGGTAQRNRG